MVTRQQLEQDIELLHKQLKCERADNDELRDRLKVARAAQIPQHVIPSESTLLTEEFLRDVGFVWEQLDRCPHKHWHLKIGPAQIVKGGFGRSSDDLIIELSMGNPVVRKPESPWWFCWIRADYAGRYSRFLFAREIVSIEQLVRLIEALTDTPFSPLNVMGGMLNTPECASQWRRESDRLDWQMVQHRADYEA